jgi:hypothetical protein
MILLLFSYIFLLYSSLHILLTSSVMNLWSSHSSHRRFDGICLALASQGAKLAKVTTWLHNAESKLHQAENEVRNLKRSASSHPEDLTPVVKKQCIEEAVRQICQLQEEHRISARRTASQQIITSQERKGRGLAPAGPPRGMMANMEMYFNWRGSGLPTAHPSPPSG